jgi:hypothetical protein
VILRGFLVQKIGFESLLGIEAELRVLREQFRQKQIATVPIFAIHHILINHYLTSLVLHVSLVIVLPLDWVDPKQQHVRNNAKTEQIAFVTVGFFALPAVLDDFWCHVAHCSASFVAFVGNCLIQKQRQSEIYYMWFERVEVDEYVLGFQVSVDNPSVMDIFDPLQNLPQQVDDNGGLSELLFLPKGHQILTRKVLHD